MGSRLLFLKACAGHSRPPRRWQILPPLPRSPKVPLTPLKDGWILYERYRTVMYRVELYA